MGEKLSDPRTTPPYTVLAGGYDFVMDHVEYEIWAEYIHGLLTRHAPEARTILELGCGTGSHAFALQPLGPYDYLATDISEQMLKVARHKAEESGEDVRFELADFTDFRVDSPVDAVLLLYDGLNYLLETEDVLKLMRCAVQALRPGGIFIVDQSTPSNSINNEPYFEHSDAADDFSYVRKSHYDRKTRLHRTVLEMTISEHRFREEHLQRAYEMSEIRQLAEKVGFTIDSMYDGFSTAPATEESERVHWVLRRPTERDAE